MNYYGTSLAEAGHYMWEIDGSGTQLHRNKMRLENCPFNPEALPVLARTNGDVGFYHCFGYTVLAICGSCRDRRTGSKSVFWLSGSLTMEEMKNKIMASPIGEKIIKQMPFEIKW